MGELTMKQIGERGLQDSEFWFPHLHHDDLGLLTHYGLGIAGEVGELVNLIKKANRDGAVPYGPQIERWDDIRKEIADVAIYLFDIAVFLGIDPAEAIEDKRAELIGRWGDPACTEGEGS